MIPYLLEYWPIAPIAIFIAAFASLMGIGGGILWAPYLILVEKLEPKDAIMISFMIQTVGMGSATYSYLKKKMLYWKIAKGMMFPLLIGLAIGAFLSQRVLHGNYIEGLLGGLTITISLLFGFQTEKYDVILNEDKKTKAPLWLKSEGTIFGFISGFLSIGSGDFIIPLLRGKLKIPMSGAIATALFLNFFVAFMGGMVHFGLSGALKIELIYILAFASFGVLLGGQLGPILSQRLDEGRLKELFIFVLLLIGLHLIYKVL
ncbi:MAG: sulfite exporter TauE/SafE family protein [Spirochaetia bacterium]|nr:sulfite exporter TauE/SafE family protein [Spirochaetia bacterium]